MKPSEWSRRRRVLVAVFAFLTAFGTSVVVFAPDDASPSIVFVLLNLAILGILVYYPEWLPGIEP
jgi:sugar phosphate permease